MKFLRSGLLIAAVLGVSQSAIAADMPMKAAGVAPAPGWSWTGFYAGIHGGWGWTDSAVGSNLYTIATAPVVPFYRASHDLSADGPVFGGHLGYNWQLNPNWVVGIEGDFTGTGIKATSTVGGTFVPALLPIAGQGNVMQRDVNWLATIRGRLGYTWGQAMIFVTGGGAWADVDRKGTTFDSLGVCTPPGAVVPGCTITSNTSATLSGWTIGGGYESAIAPNWLVRVEYLYYRLSDGITTSTTIGAAGGCGAPPCTANFSFPDLNIHTVRAGLSYKW